MRSIIPNYSRIIQHITRSPTLFQRYTSTQMHTLSSKDAIELDKELMSTGGFTLDQLMELAGLSVSQAVYKVHPPNKGNRILILCGPGNNGGDGLVASRHLWHYGYRPTVYFPKQGKKEIYQRLVTQLEQLNIPFVDDYEEAIKDSDHIIDAIFGFSFSGEVREPFGGCIEAMKKSGLPVTSVDVPSSWHVENGPPESGPGKDFVPDTLVSLTAPKPLAEHFRGKHFLGGRFVPPSLQKKYNLELEDRYYGIDQIAEI